MKKLTNEELNRPENSAFQVLAKMPVIVILDNVRSALNAGAVFRNSDAFAIQALWLCGITATPPNRDLLKTALGATESVNWKHFSDTKQAIAALREQGFSLFGIEQTTGSIPLQDFDPFQHPNGIGIIFGHEMDGVDQEVIDLCDGCIEIPQSGTKHSINVAVCSGVVLWELYRKLTLKKSGN